MKLDSPYGQKDALERYMGKRQNTRARLMSDTPRACIAIARTQLGTNAQQPKQITVVLQIGCSTEVISGEEVGRCLHDKVAYACMIDLRERFPRILIARIYARAARH